MWFARFQILMREHYEFTMFWSEIPISCLSTYIPSKSVGDICKGKLIFWNLHNSFTYYLQEEIDNSSLFEDICLRIPYLGEKILRHLDDKSLSNLKLSCKSICAFMQYQRWFWIRIIQRYIGKIEDVDETWQTAIDKGQLISLHVFHKHQL